MGTLLVTFGRKDEDLESIADASTYSLTISGEEQSMTIPSGRDVITLLPDADCWVASGRAANAEDDVARRPLVADVARRFSCRPGNTLSVIQRS